jgi:hypothetical protein
VRLSQHLVKNRGAELKGARVLDLGSGTGEGSGWKRPADASLPCSVHAPSRSPRSGSDLGLEQAMISVVFSTRCNGAAAASCGLILSF